MTEGSTGIPGTPGKGSWLTLAACCIRTGQFCASPLLNPSRRLSPAHDNKLQSDPNLGWMVPGLQHDISHAGASRCLQLADSWNAAVTRTDNRLFERPMHIIPRASRHVCLCPEDVAHDILHKQWGDNSSTDSAGSPISKVVLLYQSQPTRFWGCARAQWAPCETEVIQGVHGSVQRRWRMGSEIAPSML